MTMRKRKDMALDELIRLLIPIQDRLAKECNGYLRITMEFGPLPDKPKPEKATARRQKS